MRGMAEEINVQRAAVARLKALLRDQGSLQDRMKGQLLEGERREAELTEAVEDAAEAKAEEAAARVVAEQ